MTHCDALPAQAMQMRMHSALSKLVAEAEVFTRHTSAKVHLVQSRAAICHGWSELCTRLTDLKA